MAAPAGKQLTEEIETSGLERQDLVRAFRIMATSRRIDDRYGQPGCICGGDHTSLISATRFDDDQRRG